ncbi:MAG: choice-of-anchor Q domain-containing protein [Pseudomonadota bacterium]
MKPQRFQKAPLALALGSAMAAMAFSPSAMACTPDGSSQTFTVTNTDATGGGSLFQQVADASESAGCDIVDFDLPSGSTITVDTSVTANGQVSIQGPGSDELTVTRASGFVMNASGGDVSISGLTLADATSGLGIQEADVSLNDVVIENMESSGVYASYFTTSPSEADYTFNVKDSLITANGADFGSQGGGLYIGSFDFNAAPYGGTVDVNIENTTISGNEVSGYGGGLYLYSNGYGGSLDVTLLQSTISGNQAYAGGAVYVRELGDRKINLNALHSTVTNNTGTGTSPGTGGIVSLSTESTILNHTIVAGNSSDVDTDNPDLDGNFEAIYSFIGVDGPSATVSDDGNSWISGGDPQLLDLAALAELKGYTLPKEAMVHVPDENSPVIDAGDMALQAGEGGIPETDQAGLPRVSFDYIDIGAIERPSQKAIDDAVDDATDGNGLTLPSPSSGGSAMGPGILALLMSVLAFRRRR